MTLDDKRAVVWNLCGRLGLPHSPTTEHSGRRTPWDGATLHGRTYEIGELAHDIAHWLLAEPECRRWVGFGLGPHRGGTSETDGPVVSRVDEVTVVCVGILLLEAIGLDPGPPPEKREHYRAHLDTGAGRRAVHALLAAGVDL